MADNKTLSARQRAALDEWYTQLVDIEAELRHYRDQFRGKVVFCNCDDPYESNFFQYFAMSFNHLGLKKLISTCYAGSPISGEQLPLLETAGLRDSRPPREAYKVEISEVSDLNEDGAIDLLDVEHLLRNDANVMTPLAGDGDFRSEECVALLDESDIVVTNPPFSKFREYINLLIDKGKSFLVLGDQNGAKYSSIFPHIVANKLWFGYENGGIKWFRVPDDYEIKTEARKKVVDGVKFQSRQGHSRSTSASAPVAGVRRRGGGGHRSAAAVSPELHLYGERGIGRTRPPGLPARRCGKMSARWQLEGGRSHEEAARSACRGWRNHGGGWYWSTGGDGLAASGVSRL
jgi:hypothetical protein